MRIYIRSGFKMNMCGPFDMEPRFVLNPMKEGSVRRIKNYPGGIWPELAPQLECRVASRVSFAPQTGSELQYYHFVRIWCLPEQVQFSPRDFEPRRLTSICPYLHFQSKNIWMSIRLMCPDNWRPTRPSAVGTTTAASTEGKATTSDVRMDAILMLVQGGQEGQEGEWECGMMTGDQDLRTGFIDKEKHIRVCLVAWSSLSTRDSWMDFR